MKKFNEQNFIKWAESNSGKIKIKTYPICPFYQNAISDTKKIEKFKNVLNNSFIIDNVYLWKPELKDYKFGIIACIDDYNIKLEGIKIIPLTKNEMYWKDDEGNPALLVIEDITDYSIMFLTACMKIPTILFGLVLPYNIATNHNITIKFDHYFLTNIVQIAKIK